MPSRLVSVMATDCPIASSSCGVNEAAVATSPADSPTARPISPYRPPPATCPTVPSTLPKPPTPLLPPPVPPPSVEPAHPPMFATPTALNTSAAAIEVAKAPVRRVAHLLLFSVCKDFMASSSLRLRRGGIPHAIGQNSQATDGPRPPCPFVETRAAARGGPATA